MENYNELPFLRLLMENEGGVRVDNGSNVDMKLAFDSNRKKMYADDPDDRGGATMCGVTLATYKAMYKDGNKEHLRNMSYERWSIICQIGYWDKLGCAQYDSLPLALTVADYGFNSGVKRAATALQLALNELNEMLAWKMGKPLVIDGVVGPKTIAQVQMLTKPMQAFVCARLHDARAEFIKEAVRKGNIHVKFLTGLMNRIRRTTAYALLYI